MSAREESRGSSLSHGSLAEGRDNIFNTSTTSLSKLTRQDPTDVFLSRAREWGELSEGVSEEVDNFVKNLLDEYHAAMVTGRRSAINLYNVEADLQVQETLSELPKNPDGSVDEFPGKESVHRPLTTFPERLKHWFSAL